MNNLQTFTNAAFGSVRILYEDGKPLFCGADACKALGYKNQSKALNDHCRWVTKRYVPHPQSATKTVTMNFLTEGDLYRLITHSKLPSAEKFERWVFDEVLPAIRKSGMYGADPAELERLRQSNQALRDWFSLLAKRKQDLVAVQHDLEDVRRNRSEAKERFMTAKANYSKWCELNRTFEGLVQRAQNDINSYIDQIQIVALATPVLEEDLNTMLDDMAQQMAKNRCATSVPTAAKSSRTASTAPPAKSFPPLMWPPWEKSSLAARCAAAATRTRWRPASRERRHPPMIPAKKKQQHRDKLQQQRSRNGTAWEEQLCEELNSLPHAWARCWPKAWTGQPFDISAQVEGHPMAIECKSIVRGNLPFSALRSNEIENLSRFEDAGGTALLAIRRDEPPARVFVPWWTVRSRILAGDRGSVPLGHQPQTLAEVWEVSAP